MWPELSYEQWKDTLDTLHMWMQIVGKVKLALAPFLNQWWEVAFYITSTGMTTGEIPFESNSFKVEFDFTLHILSITTSSHTSKSLPLIPQTVAAFYQEFMEVLKTLGVSVTIWPEPVEVPNPIPFFKDTKHASYDNDYVTKWWHIQTLVALLFEKFRTPFRGKSSPIHFFWGSFDLNGTRYSGKTATPPKLQGVMGNIMRFAENEENFAFGFWPGDASFPHAAFYAYIYPAPTGIETLNLGKDVIFNEQLAEYIMLYESVWKSSQPEKMIMEFLETTYTKSAQLAGWDINALRGPIPKTHTSNFAY